MAELCPLRATCSLNPASVTAGGNSTLTLTAATSTPVGTYTVTVTGTGATNGVHTATVTFTVNQAPPSDFSISANPNSVTVTQGSSGTSTISTAVTSGATETVNLAASGCPANATCALNPTSVTSGGNSTLTLTAATTTPVSTYTVTVTGTGVPNGVHSVNVSFTVNGPSANAIRNGGFETGNLSNWTASGPATGVSNTSHSGTFSAMLGATSPVSGTSSIAQTFTAPSGTSTIRFWYQVHCPDTVTYDWATATLRDNTTNTTRTVLPRTCNNNGVWVQVSASVTAGHSYTITLSSMDDNYPGDPTYTLYDDVSVQ